MGNAQWAGVWRGRVTLDGGVIMAVLDRRRRKPGRGAERACRVLRYCRWASHEPAGGLAGGLWEVIRAAGEAVITCVSSGNLNCKFDGIDGTGFVEEE